MENENTKENEASVHPDLAIAVEEMSKQGKQQADTDRDILHAALSRITRLMGYRDSEMPEHVGDLDVTGLSEKYAGIVRFAKTAKLP
jgi:hypothetical protein